MPAFRFTTLAAVSSDEQIDKASIPSQLELTKAAGLRMGGTFVNEYILDGYSRTAYWNLDDARRDIPPLDQCLNDMHKWDVLIVKNFDRLGSLGMPMFYYLSLHKKQLHSIQQTTMIYPPDTYNPADDIAVPTMINQAGGSQIYRIHKITDAFRTGNSARAKNGLYVNAVPYGYVKIDKQHIEVDPAVAALLVKFPTWFLAGVSLREIAHRADESGIPTRTGKKWNYTVIEWVLKSTFYAGRTYYGKSAKDSAGRYNIKEHYETFEGRHEPLWDMDTHHRIQHEFQRRKSLRLDRRDYNFTGLLKCSECGKPLEFRYDHKRNRHRYWRCDRHVSIRADIAEEMITAELLRLVGELENAPFPDAATDSRDFSRRELVQVRKQMMRLEQAYEKGAYSPDEFAAKLKAFHAREAELLDEEVQHQQAKQRLTEKARQIQEIKDIQPGDLLIWISHYDPTHVKHALSSTIAATAYPDKHIEAKWL
jgi:recombinase/recombinase-like zinc beta ribbon protein